MSRGLRNFVMSDDASMDEAMAAARNEADREMTSQQLEAFHQTFNFCLSCRQYTCSNCWNQAEGRCLSCAPMFGEDGVSFRLPTVGAGGAVALTGQEAVELQDRNGHGTAAPPEPMAWPTADLMRDAESPVEGWPTNDLEALDHAPVTDDGPAAVEDATAAIAASEPAEAQSDEGLLADGIATAEAQSDEGLLADGIATAEAPDAGRLSEDHVQDEPAAAALEPGPSFHLPAAFELPTAFEPAPLEDGAATEPVVEEAEVDIESAADLTPPGSDFHLVREAEVGRDLEPSPDFEPDDALEGPFDLEPIDFAARFGTITGTEPDATDEPPLSIVVESEARPEPEPESASAAPPTDEAWATGSTGIHEVVAAVEPPADDLAAAAAANTTDLLRRFRVDDDGAATEPVAEPATDLEPEPVAAVEVEPEPIAADQAEPEPIAAVDVEPEPVDAVEVEPEPIAADQAEPEPEPIAAVQAEPVVAEPVPEPLAAVQAEPELVAAEPLLAAEPKPVAAEPVVAAEPEPTAAVEAEPVAESEVQPETVVAEPESVEATPEVEAARPGEDLVGQPTWQIVAPDTPSIDVTGRPVAPPAAPTPSDAIHASSAPPAPAPHTRPDWTPEPAPSQPRMSQALQSPEPRSPESRSPEPQSPQPQWPRQQPGWPGRQPPAGVPFLDHPAAAAGGIEELWAESARELASAAPVAGTRTGIQPCVNCGLSLSASARFCRRCGTRQT